jgi:HK97 family phage major capsid protein
MSDHMIGRDFGTSYIRPNIAALRTVAECDDMMATFRAALGEAENKYKAERRSQTTEEANRAADISIAVGELESHRASLQQASEQRWYVEQRMTEERARDADADATFRALMERPVERRAAAQPYTAEDRAVADAFRSGVIEGNPTPILVRSSSPRSNYQPGIEQRDLLTSSPASFQPVSMYDHIVRHMVETSAVMSAGATVISTDHGEDYRIPKSTAHGTAALVAEAAGIPEADPTLGVYTMKAYKYGVLIQVSTEMVQDTSTDLIAYLSEQAGIAIGNAIGNKFINGSGSGEPRGILQDSTAGITAPTGCATSFGSQATAGQGTDLLNGLVSSLSEPYTRSKSAGFLLRTATLGAIRNLKASTGELVGNQYLASSPYPFLVDPFVPAMAANAKSVLYGDWSRYFIRMVNGIRFERSQDYAFANDLVTYRALVRVDGALIDTTGAIKHLAHSAT